MITPVRNATAHAQRVAGSRVVAGARNVAEVSEAPTIETAAATKRTGAQEESLLNQSLEIEDTPVAAAEAPKPAVEPDAQRQLDRVIEDSLAWNQLVRDATEAYRNTLEYLDQTQPKLKPGEVYDVPS